jgi:hypothetical protein
VIDAPYGSHLPALLTCVAATKGPILEVGIGHYSTPVLHAFSKRRLVSVEADLKWMDTFRDFESLDHMFTYPADYASALEELCAYQWGVVFLDAEPGSAHAARAALFVDSAEFIVVHDYSSEQVSKPFEPVLPLFKHHHVYTRYMPSTLILSQQEIPRMP